MLGCEVSPDVNISAKRYNIRLFEPSNDVLAESCIRCETVSITIIMFID